jgi:hypothetical protein
MGRSTGRCTGLLGILILLLGGAAQANDPPAALKVARRKALFVEQFTRLVDWPARALPPEAPFVLCLAGQSPTAEELSKLAAVRRFKDRRCEVRRPRAPAELAGCHVLYLAPTEAPRLSQELGGVAGRPVLTVSDTAGFVQRGVQFNLFEETRDAPQPGTYVNFELNVDAVKRSLLTFDPRLLTAGRRVGATP